MAASSPRTCHLPPASSIRGLRARTGSCRSRRRTCRGFRSGWRAPAIAARWRPLCTRSCELGMPIVLALLCIYFLGTTSGLFIGAPTAILGYMMPSFWLSRQIEKQKKLIANGLPDALDLLIVCVEAGMGLDQAIAKAAEELSVSHPRLSEELGSSQPRFAPASLEWKRSRTSPRARRWTTSASSCRCSCKRIVRDERCAGSSHPGGGESHQAPPAGRGASREARRQARLPARVLPVSGNVRRHSRPGRHQVREVLCLNAGNVALTQ